MTITIRQMTTADIPDVASIHEECFPRQKHSLCWIETNLNAFPKTFCYVIENEKNIMGYIHWTQKSGFRQDVILELEQLAVSKTYQNQGIAKKLMKESLPHVKNYLQSKGSILKHILVTTRHDNHAKKIYESTLGATVEHVIKDVYPADEVVLIARNIA